jgi:TetR/AcrR family fatty acid metabolism transcriptional regulator
MVIMESVLEPLLENVRARLDAFLQPDGDPRQARKRERILAAATERFTAFGYRKTSIEDVARAAGVAKGTVYLYYRSKPELLFHAVAHEKRCYLDRLQPLWGRELEPRERLREMIRQGLVMKREMPLVTRLTGGDRELAIAMEEIDTDVLSRIGDLQRQVTEKLLDEATGGTLPDAELAARAEVLIHAIFAVVTAPSLMPGELTAGEQAARMADLLVSGVAAPCAAPVPKAVGAAS